MKNKFVQYILITSLLICSLTGCNAKADPSTAADVAADTESVMSDSTVEDSDIDDSDIDDSNMNNSDTIDSNMAISDTNDSAINSSEVSASATTDLNPDEANSEDMVTESVSHQLVTGISCETTENTVMLTISESSATLLTSVINADFPNDKLYNAKTVNDDLSVTYEMSAVQHQLLMDTLEEILHAKLLDCTCSDAFPDMIKIDASDDFTNYSIVTTNDSLSAAERISPDFFKTISSLYVAFAGTDTNEITLTYHSATSGKEISTITISL